MPMLSREANEISIDRGDRGALDASFARDADRPSDEWRETAVFPSKRPASWTRLSCRTLLCVTSSDHVIFPFEAACELDASFV